MDFSVNATFSRSPESFLVPLVPVQQSFAGGAFSHLVGYTIAKMGELNRRLYEVTIQSETANVYLVEVGFSYRRSMDERVFETSLERAASLVELVVTRKPSQRPVAGPVPAPAPATEASEETGQ
jgi:hypothetical protein